MLLWEAKILQRMENRKLKVKQDNNMQLWDAWLRYYLGEWGWKLVLKDNKWRYGLME